MHSLAVCTKTFNAENIFLEMHLKKCSIAVFVVNICALDASRHGRKSPEPCFLQCDVLQNRDVCSSK